MVVSVSPGEDQERAWEGTQTSLLCAYCIVQCGIIPCLYAKSLGEVGPRVMELSFVVGPWLKRIKVLRQSRAIRKRQEKKRRQKEKKALLKNPTARLELVQREVSGQVEAVTAISSATAAVSGSHNTEVSNVWVP